MQIFYVPLPDSDRKVIALHVEDTRLNRVTTTMPQATYERMLLQRDGGKYRWELFEDKDLTLQDIDSNEVQKTVRLGIEYGRLPEDTGNDLPVIMEKLGLLKNGILNHAAAVLFANHEMPEYSQCLLRLARFKGTNKTVFMDNQRIQGNLFQLLNAAMAFIFKHLSLSGTTDTLEREEHLTVPYKAIREGVVNALTHRSYREAGGSVGIAIYDDRVEIENPGAFPHDWDMEKMKSEHCSEPQNPLIATILYKRKMLENWGCGISLMMDECQKAGLPEPEYRLGNGFVVLVFRYGENNHISTTKVQSLLEIVGNATLSVKEIMDLLQLKNRSYFSKEYLKPALETGLLEPIYPEQPSHPKQKYRLTDKGKKSLNQQFLLFSYFFIVHQANRTGYGIHNLHRYHFVYHYHLLLNFPIMQYQNLHLRHSRINYRKRYRRHKVRPLR